MDGDATGSPVYNQLKSLLFVDSNTDQQSPQQLSGEEDGLWGLTKQQLLEWSQEHSATGASAAVTAASLLEDDVDVGGTNPVPAKCTSSSHEEAAAAAGTSKRRSAGGSNLKFSTDPQSVAARLRRKRISERFKTLQKLVPGGTKMDTASMLDEAITYVKFLKQQIWLHELAANGGVPASTSTATSMTTTRVPAIKYDPSSLEAAEEVAKGWNDRD